MKNQLLITKTIILIKNILNGNTLKKIYHAQCVGLQLVINNNKEQPITNNNPLQIQKNKTLQRKNNTLRINTIKVPGVCVYI